MKRNITRYILLAVGLVILLFFIFVAAFPKVFTSYGTKEQFELWQGVSSSHILGTNDMGYDIFTELVYGTRSSLLIGVSAGLLSVLFGVIIGVLAAVKGIAGRLFNGLITIFILLPTMIVLLVISSYLKVDKVSLIFLIAAFRWVPTARVVKAQVERIWNSNYIQAAKVNGYSFIHILVRHVVPNLYDIIIARIILSISSAILMESTLSFLGIGDTFNASWGTMVNFAFKRGALFYGALNYLLSPSICIILISVGLYFISLFFERNKEQI